ncbi:hypothetical protein OF83DRAFT_657232 [Amylostereum chailletii]|nr:hypothetical protein OF83DRAFT_657232 [Amylostereum chailletii]
METNDQPIPRYIYKILDSTPPSPLPPNLPLSDLDAADGFIHLSAAWRVPSTASMYFSTFDKLWIMRLDGDVARKERASLEWADPGCVHMFAEKKGEWARMGEGIVVDVREFTRGDGGSWETVLGKEVKGGWLLD